MLGGDSLTEREVEVLALAASGVSARRTGEKLHLSDETVKGYRKRIVAKLQALNIAHAVALGCAIGLVNCEAVLEEWDASH